MSLKSALITFVLTFIYLGALLAQPPMHNENNEGNKKLKIGIYTKILELTDAESEKFWPKFNEMETKLNDVRMKGRTLKEQLQSGLDDKSDAEIEKMLDKMVELRLKEVEIRSQYYQEFKNILPVKKVALMFKAERVYKKALFSKLQEGEKSHKPKGRPMR